MLLKMAWRNLWRRKRRTLITSITIAIGLWVAISFSGIADYSYTKMINTSASMGFGHVSIEPVGYINSPTIEKRIHSSDETLKKLLETEGVSRAYVKIVGQGMVSTATRTVGGIIIGADPTREKPEDNLFIRAITEGKMFADADASEVVVGKRLAEKLNLKIGKKLIYTSTDIHGEIVSDMARVCAIFRTGDEGVDSGTILLPIGKLRKTLHFAPQDATVISVFISDQRYAEKMRDKLKTVFNSRNTEIFSWQETQRELAGAIALDGAIDKMFQVFVWLLVATGILDAMLMSVLERRHEMGVMMAVGMPPSTLFFLLMVESFFTAIFGFAIAIIINTPWYWFMNLRGIDLSSMVPEGYGVSGVIMEPTVKIMLYGGTVVWIVITFFSLAIVAGLYPAFKASRVPPVESMKIY
jgi:ABC-type lipoprotein release transport system permease subunit